MIHSIYDHPDIRKPTETGSARGTQYRRLINDKGWIAHPEFNNDLYAYSEDSYDLIEAKIPLAKWVHFVLQHPFFCTIFEKKRTHVPLKIRNINTQTTSEMPSHWSPLELLENRLNIPQNFAGQVLTQYYSGCRDPVCSAYIGLEPCSANIRIAVSNDGLTVSFYAQGRHCPLYKPVHGHLVPRPDAKRVIKNNTGDSVRVLAAKLHEQVPNYNVPPRMALSQTKYNITRSAKVNFSNPLGGAIEYLLESENWILLGSVAGREIEHMTNEDFTLIMLHRQTWFQCCNTIGELVGFDGVWKTLKLAHIDKDSGKIPLYVLTCLDNERRTQVPAIMLSTKHCADTWASCLEEIAVKHKREFSTEWLPTFMIDDGSVEKAALNQLSADYFLCKFHVIQAWERQLCKINCNVKEKAELYKILFQMFSVRTETQYNQLYAQLKRLRRATFGSFQDYFTAHWHMYNGENFYKRWTCIDRPSSYGLWNTNNATERIMRDIQEHLEWKACKNIEEYVKSIDAWMTLRRKNQQRTRKTQTERDALERLERGRQLWSFVDGDNEDAEPSWYGSTSVEHIRFFKCSDESEDVIYTADLLGMSCNCMDYIRNCRPCKHLFCSMFAYLHENEITLSDAELKDPFELQHQISIRMHKKAIFKDNSRTTAYPAIRKASTVRRTTKVSLMREELRQETSARNTLRIAETAHCDDEVTGFRYSGNILEIRVATNNGAAWRMLTPAIDDSFHGFLEDLKEKLKKTSAKKTQQTVEAVAVILREEDYYVNTLEEEDIPLSGSIKAAVEQLLKRLSKGKSRTPRTAR